MSMGQNNIGAAANGLTSRGQQNIALGPGAVALTIPPAIGTNPVVILFQAQGGGARARFDGVAPAPGDGLLLADGRLFGFQPAVPTNIQVCEDATNPGGTLNVQYFTYATLDQL